MSNKFGGPFIAVPKWTLPYIAKDATALTILILALQYMDWEEQTLTTSYGHLAELSGFSRRTVIRAMNRLNEIGVIIKSSRYGSGGNITNIYKINFNNPKSLGVPSDTSVTPLVSPVTPPSDTSVTPRGVTRVTQYRITSNKNKYSEGGNELYDGYTVDKRLFK
jgi:hypothetical protein